MGELDRMLDPPTDQAVPSLVRFYQSRKRVGDHMVVAVERPDGVAGRARTQLVVRRWVGGVGGVEQEPKSMEWDDGVNAGLIELGVRAEDLDQEGQRFALALRAALRKAERMYGDGYLNIVFVNLLDESDLCRDQPIARVREHVFVNNTDRNRTAYAACREIVAGEIGARAAELREFLEYDRDQVKQVMTSALATYLDERFSVSNRRTFGLL